jgi:hypothetical protein
LTRLRDKYLAVIRFEFDAHLIDVSPSHLNNRSLAGFHDKQFKTIRQGADAAIDKLESCPGS